MDEQSIFQQALDKTSDAERSDWLDEVCGSDASLRKRIETLLASHEQAGSFLEKPAPEFDATIVQTAGDVRAESLQAGLTAAFAGDQAVFLGDGNHSVLKMLEQTLDKVPHVVLRDSVETGGDPIVRPKSAEMPERNSDNRYRLDGEIARGGMGAILKGRDTDLGRDLAIKVLLDQHKDKPEVVQRFVEEAQIGGQLQHPGIAPIYELGQFADKRPFFAMKLVKGETLSKLMADRKGAAAERGKFIGIFEQICQTMAYAHSRGVIHRDLKPSNIMVGAFGEVQVMDWGLAKVLQVGGVADEKTSHTQHKDISIIQTMRNAVGSDSPGAVGSIGSHTQMGSVMGTPAYMPPEQALGEIDQMDERADVFGLGAILAEILTGKPPYVGDDGTAVFRQASRGRLADCFERLDACGADDDLIGVTRDCLEVEPKDRPRDAGVLAVRVTGYLESVETRLREAEVEGAAQEARADAEAAQAAAERLRAEAESARAEAESAHAREERKRRRTSLALAASVLLLVGLGSGGWLYMAHQEASRQTAEAAEQRNHATEMEDLAEQRNAQRRSAEKAEAEALNAKLAAEQDRAAAIAAQETAEAAEEHGRRLLYATDMQLAPLLWKDNDATLAQLGNRLNAHNPDKNPILKGKEDLRGFEWYYFQNLLENSGAVFARQGETVADARLTADGFLVTLTNQGQVRRWDLNTREEDPASRRDLVTGDRDPVVVSSAVLSADGRLAALAAGFQVHVFDTSTAQKLWQVTSRRTKPRLIFAFHSKRIFSPDSKFLVSVGDMIHWRDVADGQIIAEVQQRFAGGGDFALSADGRALVIAGNGGQGGEISAFHFSATTGKAQSLYETIDLGGTLGPVALSPDGRLIAVGAKLSGNIKVLDTAKGNLVAQHGSAHSSPISAIAFSADGARLATAGTQGTIKIWGDAEKLNSESDPLITLKGHTGWITRLGFSADGTQLVSASADATARVWDLSSPGVAIQSLARSTTKINPARFSRDGSLIAAVDGNRVRLWDVATGQLLRQLPAAEMGQPYSVAFSPTNNRLLAVGYGGTAGVSHVSMWDIYAGVELDRLPAATDLPNFTVTEYTGVIGALAFSPDGKYLVAGFGSPNSYSSRRSPNPLQVWEVETRRPIRRLKGHTGYCVSLDFSADGKLLASGGYDGRAILWSTDTWKPTQTLVNLDPGSTYSYSQDRKFMVGGVAFSPDGATLAVASHGRNVNLWDVGTGNHLATLAGHSDAVHSIAFSPDGRTLVSSSSDQTVRLWNLATRRELMQLDSGNVKFGRVASLTFSPDGKQLLAGGGSTAFWSAAPSSRQTPDLAARQLQTLLDSRVDFQSAIRMHSDNLRLHEALAKLDSQDPRVAAALAATRAHWHASKHRWAEATEEFDRLQQFGPDAPQAWLKANGLLRVVRALFDQNQSARGSKLLVAAARQLDADGITRANLTGIQYAQNSFPIRVTDVTADSPANRAGLRVGDVISKVNEVELTAENVTQFSSLLEGEPGTRLQLTVQHAGSDQPEQVGLTKEFIYSDQQFAEQVHALQSEVNRRLVETPDDVHSLEIRAELFGLQGNSMAQIADYSALIEALSTRPENETAADLARLYGRRGNAHLARQQWQPAIDDYARAITDATKDEDLLANQALAEANASVRRVSMKWRPLQPTEMKSEGHATLTLQSDGSIFVDGANPGRDTYVITAPANPGTIAALLVEVIPDPRLPNHGPGRPGDGTIALTGVTLSLKTKAETAFVQTPFGRGASDIGNAESPIKRLDTKLWGIWPEMGKPHQLVLYLREPIVVEGNTTLQIQLEFLHHVYPGCFGRFRLSVSDDPAASWESERPTPESLAAIFSPDPWTRLAAGYRLVGDQAALDRLVARRPQAASGIGDLFLAGEMDAQKDWQRAVEIYSKGIALTTRDTVLLAKRARAYEGLKNWEAAAADWDRVAEGTPNPAKVFAEFAQRLSTSGPPSLFTTQFEKAQTLYQRSLELDADNDVVAMELAQLLRAKNAHQRAERWTVLKPIEWKSTGGTTLTLQADGSILPSGTNPESEVYTIVAETSADPIRSMRLEVLPDPSIQNGAVGRAEGGHFTLTEITASRSASEGAGEPEPLQFTSAWASHVNESIGTSIDGESEGVRHWNSAAAGNPQVAAVAIFELSPHKHSKGSAKVTINLVFHDEKYKSHNLGRFRLSVSNQPSSLDKEKQYKAAMKLTDPWAKLAAAHHLLGEQAAFDRLLQSHPEAESELGNPFGNADDWQLAIDTYDTLITREANDPRWFANRARAHAALQQWALAIADWKRATELRPDNPWYFARRARAHAALQQWALAKADWKRASELRPDQIQRAFDVFREAERWGDAAEFGLQFIEAKPEDEFRWLTVAPVLVLAGDDAGYADFCDRAARQFANIQDPAISERITKATLLRAGAIAPGKLPTKPFIDSHDAGMATNQKPWAWADRALLAYRNGDAESAVQYVTRSEELKPVDYAHAMNLAVLALAQHQLHDPDEARNSLDGASRLIQSLRENPQKRGNNDLLIAEILLREAEAKINGKTDTN